MLSEKGFDAWSKEYDASVAASEQEASYPFAGYGKLQELVCREICGNRGGRKAPVRVLDIGFGTGVLTGRLYEAGCDITGIDFSRDMIRIAAERMPNARLIHWDFSRGLPEEIRGETYDFIVSTYALHHLADDRKKEFVRSLLACCRPGGEVLIGDVSFENEEQLKACRAKAGEAWDGDECYSVASQWTGDFPELTFYPVSCCAGLMVFRRRQI